jgi:HEAT repeat protein
MDSAPYTPPVDALLNYGDTRRQKWPDYIARYSFTAADLPELIRMATDAELNWAESESAEVWAPVHAWRALGQLKAEAAVEPLIAIFNEMDESDWFREEMPEVLSLIGPVAIPKIAEFLADSKNLFYMRWVCTEALAQMGQAHPNSRDECIGRLVKQLEQHSKNSRELNSAVICALLDLNAKEAAAQIEAAFKAKRVDTSITEDWLEVQKSLGLLTASEVKALRNHVDTEHLGAKATKLNQSTTGFGQVIKSGQKKKK